MNGVRNVAFAFLCVALVIGAQEPSRAANFERVDDCSIQDVSPGGCENAYPVCYFEGECPDGYCLDALNAAVETCDDNIFVLENFDCEEPYEPPTYFTFWCDWHEPYPH